MRRSGPALAALALASAACGRSAAPPAEEPLPFDLSGTWAGTWSGSNRTQGFVTGTWEAEVRQLRSGLTGTVVLAGDVDCPDATIGPPLDGAGDGSIQRPPCQPNVFTVTGVDTTARVISGDWAQPATSGIGAFSGTQIATPGGPHVTSHAPPSGPKGALVTISGRGFSADPGGTTVAFDGVPATTVLRATLDTVVAQVPAGAGNGRIAVTTRHGTGLSPRPFDARATSPQVVRNAVYGGFALPDGVAFGPEGRRAYVANRATGRVTMLDLLRGEELVTTPVDPPDAPPVQGVAVSPDGRRIYAASGPAGVAILDSAMNLVVDVVPVAAGEGTGPNPQGLALAGDGRTLLVADDRDGGAFSVVDLASRAVVATVSRGPGARPTAVTASPDGRRAYLAFAGAAVVDVLDVEAAATVATIPVDPAPAGIAVSADGARAWISSATRDRVLELDAEAPATVAAVAVGAAPAGLALSPDGTRLHVANRGDGTVSVVDVAARAVESTVPVCSGPGAIAMSPDGRLALVACDDGAVVELGGDHALRVAIQGSGYGRVVSAPEGIVCGGVGGSSCLSRFAPGTEVTLVATPDAWSSFTGWSGDCAADGRVTMGASRTCTATFRLEQERCFVATAAFGDPDAREVRVLRAFRDRVLLRTAPGRALVAGYYAASPPLARLIARNDRLRAAARVALAPVVRVVERPGEALLVTLALAVAAAALVRRRRARRGGAR